ncbi:MAG: ABC transporter [Novosphingobium sp.]|nr:ABC transporter [Novosphingobium sp.]
MAAAILLALLLAAGAWLGQRRGENGDARVAPRAPLLLFTSLPIYWSEAPDIAAQLKGGGEPHWARRAIEARRALRPVDALESRSLGGDGDLLMIQPRPLAPAENVALDAWIGGGGRLLLFADPALTSDSDFALGDRRRPQDIVLLSPILARWGLRLEFDEDQELGERAVKLGNGATVPVNLSGRFAIVPGGRADRACQLRADGLLAQCKVGRGRVLAIADAALFESAPDEAGQAARRIALASLLDRAF